jgi:hypothetical protein
MTTPKKNRVKYFLLLPFILISFLTKGQIIRNETISSWGTASVIFVDGTKIQQSVGQLSVIGNFSSSEWTASQGFLRGLPSKSFVLPEPFFVIPFPNSFSERITFRFVPGLSEEASFSIYNLDGKVVYKNPHKPFNNEVTLNLDFLSNALYLVIIQSGNRVLQTRIIKKT